MAKSKPRNRNKNRSDPTAKQVKPPSDPELAALREKSILPVIKDLQSAELKTRSAAARAITNLIEDTKTRKLLLREQIVRILLEQTLTDSSLETSTDGWGILRNLALEEESDFCIHLFRQDILTTIEGVIRTIIPTLESQDPPFTKLPQAQRDVVWNLTSSLVSLISSLGEAQDEILDAITKPKTVIVFLFGLLSSEFTPADIQNEVLSCLMVLTEDNKALTELVVQNEAWLKKLIEIKESEGANAVAACGVLHNVFVAMQWFDHNTPMEGASDAMLIPTLAQLIEQAPPVGNRNDTNGHSSYSSPDQVLQLALEITASIATSLQEALEHGSRHEKEFEGFGDDELGEDDEMGADDEDLSGHAEDDDDEMHDDEIDADMDLVTGDGPDDEEAPTEEITLDRLVRVAAPKILFLAHPTHDQNNPAQSLALSALNNIAWTMSTIDFSSGQLGGLHKFWATLSQHIWDQIISPVLASNTADIELASAITSLAWAVSRSVKGQIKFQPEEQRKFMALYQASKGLGQPETQLNGAKKPADTPDAFQGLGVKCIGVLGNLALSPAPIELNREIGIFLLTTLSALPETPAADMIEALNELFDIYADKDYAYDEPVFWGDNFYKHLEDVQPKAKKTAKGIDKRFFGELRARADEAILNLGRFLVYKRKERKHKKEEL